jgi:hypothetical protein
VHAPSAASATRERSDRGGRGDAPLGVSEVREDMGGAREYSSFGECGNDSR